MDKTNRLLLKIVIVIIIIRIIVGLVGIILMVNIVNKGIIPSLFLLSMIIGYIIYKYKNHLAKFLGK